MVKINYSSRIHTPYRDAAAAKLRLSCLTLCDPIDRSPGTPGSPVPGILQARTLEWVTISFSNAWKWKVKVKLLSRVRLLATPWTAAYQAPLSMDFPGESSGVGCHCLKRSQNSGKKKRYNVKKLWAEIQKREFHTSLNRQNQYIHLASVVISYRLC